MEQSKEFTAYEYLSLSVDSDMKAIYADCYQNFGWILDGFGSSSISGGTITLKLKRDRRIEHRTQLNELQRECESSLENIYRLENSKNTKPMMYSLGLGILGTVCLAGATFCFLGGYIIWCIILAIPGFIGWGLPYFAFKSVKRNQVKAINPKIDQEYDNVYKLCEQANGLL